MKTKKLFLVLFTCFFASSISATIHTINAGGYYYTPSSLSINFGDTVEWINDGGMHDVNADINSQTFQSFGNPVSFQSSTTNITNAIIYTHIFTVAGTYNYDCSVGAHAAAGMVGTITVAPSNSIYDIVSNSPIHNYLELCIDTCNLDATLSAPGSLTLFAPTDAAFLALPPNTVASLLNNLPLLTQILTHHVVQGSVMSASLSNNQVVTTLLGSDVVVTITGGNIYIDNAIVTLADSIADNGVVHIIDAVLLPSIDCAGIVDGIAALDSCGTCHQSYVYGGMGNLNYIDTYADTLNFQGSFILAGSVMDQQFNPNWVNDPALCSNTVYDIVSNSTDHNTLEAAINACSLDGLLSGTGPFTLFAPTDAAFQALGTGVVGNLLQNLPQLTNILKHHVVGDSLVSTLLTNNLLVETLFGIDVKVTIVGATIYIDDAIVTFSNIPADNGVVHVIDAVLSLPTNTIYDIVSKSDDHTTLKTAIDLCGLDGALDGPGPFTLFAPTNAAFDALDPGVLAALLANITELTDILKHHVVADSVMSITLTNNQVVPTLLGTNVTVTVTNGDVYIDNAMVTVADNIADNGVVHIIDAVLLPPLTSIHENLISSDVPYLYSVNILGMKVDKYLKNQIVFDVYGNGDVIRRFIK